MKKLKVKGSWMQFIEPLKNLETFDTHGSLRGSRREVKSLRPSVGKLDKRYHRSVQSEYTDYIVWSYDTPIAWHNSLGWYMPDERYSVTTTTQQGRIRTALSSFTEL